MTKRVFAIVAILMISLPVAFAVDSYGNLVYGSGCYGLSNCSDGGTEETSVSEGASSSSGRNSGGFATSIRNDPSKDSSEKIPSNLLDVTFKIEEPRLNSSRRVVSVTTLQNFGTSFFSANLEYNVYNDHHELVYNSIDVLDVQTENVAIKRFEDLYLSNGNYVLELVVRYSNITERFDQKFEITGKSSTFLFRTGFLFMVLLGLIISMLIILATIYFLSKKRRYRSYGF